MQIDRPITIGLILFIILLLIFFLVLPEYNTMGQLKAQLGEKRAEFNAEFDYYAAIAKTYSDLQSRKDDVSKIDDALPQNADLGRIVYFLQQAATENGIIVKGLFLSKAASPGAGAGTKDIIFSMDILGGYPALQQFIISLENSSRIFEVTNIAFGAASQPPPGTTQTQFQVQQTFEFNVQVTTHSY
jgi:Tfp pilus assembly protein PilO